eukprot:637385-Amphidinium_carterae.4
MLNRTLRWVVTQNGQKERVGYEADDRHVPLLWAQMQMTGTLKSLSSLGAIADWGEDALSENQEGPADRFYGTA